MKKAQRKLQSAATAADSVAVMIPAVTPAKMMTMVIRPPKASKKAFPVRLRLNLCPEEIFLRRA